MPTLIKFFPLWVALLLPAVPQLCRADQGTLDQAEKLYQSGDWEKARQAYKTELMGDPNRLPPSFYFNYGTILSKVGAPGEAYVLLMKAAFAQPFDSDTKHNLRHVQQTIPASVRSVQPALWFSWWPDAFRTIPWQALLLLGLIISAVAFSLAGTADRSIWFAITLTSALVILISGLAYYQARLPVYGVVTLAKVKSGPAATFTDITSLEPGSLVNEESQRSGWHKVRFVKGGAEETIGWMEPASLIEVR